jgi:hypothetical protein
LSAVLNGPFQYLNFDQLTDALETEIIFIVLLATCRFIGLRVI